MICLVISSQSLGDLYQSEAGRRTSVSGCAALHATQQHKETARRGWCSAQTHHLQRMFELLPPPLAGAGVVNFKLSSLQLARRVPGAPDGSVQAYFSSRFCVLLSATDAQKGMTFVAAVTLAVAAWR